MRLSWSCSWHCANTEEQYIAYSKDNGRTWNKYNDGEPVLKITDDPLRDERNCRDPKVFYNEEAGKWFMVVAGGPLRFFSSDNLKDWKPKLCNLKLLQNVQISSK